MSKLQGLTSDESVLHRTRCTYDNIMGDLVITKNGIVFLKAKGMLGQDRERLKQLHFDEIVQLKTKKKKSCRFNHCIEVKYHTKKSEIKTDIFSCDKHKSVLFTALFDKQKLLLREAEESSTTIQSLSRFKRYGDLLRIAKNPKMKPYVNAFFLQKIESIILSQLRNKPQVDLLDLTKNKQLHNLIACLHRLNPKKLSKNELYKAVTDIVNHLIARRQLDGIITEVGSYVSNRSLGRSKMPYDMLADFETIFAQLYENGFLIYKIECPICFRKIKYPKKGKKTSCQFCKSQIDAIDLFKKVKDLL